MFFKATIQVKSLVYGLFEEPEPESEPMICLVTNREGTKGQFPCTLQWIEGNTWMNWES